MLENCKSAKERWGGVNNLIDKWLKERQALIVKLCDLSVNPGSSVENKVEKLQAFCQLLVDYVSVGHFEVYEQLLQEAKDFNDGEGTELAQRTIPKIQASTEVALNFNDRFDNIHKVDDGAAELIAELDTLGKTLEDRFELEDLLIESLHKAYADSVA